MPLLPEREDPPLEVVSNVDIAKYLGRWYEIARYPNWFQKNCYAVAADYELAKNGSIKVVNRCREGGLDGTLREVVGTASIVNDHTNAKLKVSFYWPFYGDYWIIALGNDYEYAIVSEPGRRYLWILSRKPTLGKLKYDKLIKDLGEQSFDVSLLAFTPQNKSPDQK